MYYQSCNICGNIEFDRFLPAMQGKVDNSPFEYSYISICKECGFMFVNPVADIKTMSEFTKKITSNNQFGGDNPTIESLLNERMNILKHLDRKPLNRLLNIASGQVGQFLHKFKNTYTNCEVFGIDINNNAVRFGRKSYRLDNLYCSTFDDFEFPENYFDIITTGVFHFNHSPANALQKIKRILKPDGNLYLEFGMLMCRNDFSEFPGYRLDLEDWFYLNQNLYCWYHEEHIRSLLISHGFEIIENGQHIFNPYGYPQLVYWFCCKNKKNTTTSHGTFSLSGMYSKVTDYFFDYCERHTVSDLNELLQDSPKTIGLLGPTEVNWYIAAMIQKILPVADIWNAEFELDKREGEKSNGEWPESKGLESTSIQELMSDKSELDMILVTALLEEEEFNQIAEKLKMVSDRIYQGFYVRPGEKNKTSSVFYYNQTLKEKRLLKSFVPYLISKKD